MRQMDTILVAVGLPTKEVPGASLALPQTVTITKGTVNTPDKTLNEQQVTETQMSAEEPETRIEESENINDEAKTEETCDGWDIPDISDLLDSLNETEPENRITDGNNLPHTPVENATNNDTASAFNAQYDGVEDTESDNEDVSWSWDDTHWTAEHTHKQKQPDL